MAEAQPTPDPGLIRVRKRVGHLLSAAAAATASRPLLAPPAAAPLSAAAAALPAAGSWADCSHRGLLSFLLWRRNGGHRCHHVVGLLAVVGGEEVGPGAQRLLVCHLRLDRRMRSSLGSLLRNKQLKKALFSWPLGQSRSISASSSDGF